MMIRKRMMIRKPTKMAMIRKKKVMTRKKTMMTRKPIKMVMIKRKMVMKRRLIKIARIRKKMMTRKRMEMIRKKMMMINLKVMKSLMIRKRMILLRRMIQKKVRISPLSQKTIPINLRINLTLKKPMIKNHHPIKKTIKNLLNLISQMNQPIKLQKKKEKAQLMINQTIKLKAQNRLLKTLMILRLINLHRPTPLVAQIKMTRNRKIRKMIKMMIRRRMTRKTMIRKMIRKMTRKMKRKLRL